MRRLLFLFTLLLIFSNELLGATEITGNNIIFGLTGGKSFTHGYYENQLKDGYNWGIFINYSFLKNKFLLFESDFSYTELSLKRSTSSEFAFYSIGLGPVLNIPLWPYVNPYVGLLASLNYFELSAVMINKNERTIKPGAIAKIGSYFPVYNNISINIGMKYSINELSEKFYQNSTYYIGASYILNIIPEEKVQNISRQIENITRQIEVDEYYESGLKYFKNGDGVKSKDFFNKVISYDKNYKEVEYYLKIIKTNEQRYENALKLISENKIYEALPLLIDVEKYIIEGRNKLHELRLQLSKEEKILEEQGIEAYANEDYERCIYFMNKVQLINPENESAKIYLPRAIKRYNALKKFE